MGSVKLGFCENFSIKWPNLCAVCNSQSTDWAKSSITNTIKIRYYVVALSFTHRIYTLSYPVCKKHKFICNLVDQPARGSLLQNVIALIFIPAIVWIILALPTAILLGDVFNVRIQYREVITNLLGIPVLVATILFVIYALFFKPVKISHLAEDSMKIKIKNDRFLNEFKALNMDNIIK
jgi:hypothetical protein